MPDFSLRRRVSSPSKVKVYADETGTTSTAATHRTNSSRITGRRRSGTDVSIWVTDVDIYYGSTTGTSEKYAHTVARAIGNHGVHTSVYCLSSFDPEIMTSQERTAQNRATIFVVSTHGEGGPSETAQRFYDWLQAERKGESSLSVEGEARTGSSSPLRFVMKMKEGYVKRKQIKKRLKGMKYAVFGIGSTAYIKYNAMGIFVDNAFNELGATRLCKIGLGNSLLDPEEDYLLWQSKMLKIFPPLPHSRRERDISSPSSSVKLEPFPSTTQPQNASSTGLLGDTSGTMLATRNTYGRLRYACRLMTHEEAKGLKSVGSMNDLTYGNGNLKGSSFLTPCMIQLHSIELLCGNNQDTTMTPSEENELALATTTTTTTTTTNQVNNVILLNISIEDEKMRYEPADNFALFPHNSSQIVEEIACCFQYDLDLWFDLSMNEATGSNSSSQKRQLPFRTPCSIRTALTEYCELSSVTREFIRIAAGYVEVDKERDLLEHLASADGSSEFNKRFLRQNKGLLDLLNMTPSLKLPFEVFVNIVSLIKPRLYTIANSPLLCPRNIELLISQPNPPVGLTTCYVTQLLADKSVESSSSTIRGFVTASGFRLPSDKTAPIIMIANGVGIGPMRAMLQHRDVESRQSTEGGQEDGHQVVLNYLFFGCRNKESILFEKELDQWQSKGLVQIHYGFSRDPNHPNQYVQGVVAQYLQEIYDIVTKHPHARIYVCGRTEMARKVRQVLQSSNSSSAGHLHKTPSGEAWFDGLLQTGRYIEEAWG